MIQLATRQSLGLVRSQAEPGTEGGAWEEVGARGEWRARHDWAVPVVAAQGALHDGSTSLATHHFLPVFSIKLCGIRSLEEAAQAIAAGPDAIGLNFFAKSRRYVAPDMAAQIVRELPTGISSVALFVNSSLGEIRLISDAIKIDYLQLHGDESPEQMAEIASLGIPIVRAMRLGELPDIDAYLARCLELGVLPAGILLDAVSPGQYGGTGQLADWGEASRWHEVVQRPPMILAGGLVPENVADAVRVVRPFGVDTASGIETAGVKDPAKMRSFVLNARTALEAARR